MRPAIRTSMTLLWQLTIFSWPMAGLCQCFAGPFDPWRGRYFIAMGIFLAPLAGPLLARVMRPFWNAYTTLVVLAACLAALTAVAWRDNRPLLPPSESVFQRTRLEQLAVNRPRYIETIKHYEEIVPAGAVVAICLEPNSYEYPLFGEGLTRRLIPVNSFQKGVQPIPPEADYLVYNFSRSRPSPYFDPEDVRLGRDWLDGPMDVFLKKLKN